MPSAAKNEIIDLTDIVEEGHPETPNLKTTKPSAAKDETLDDLDLEREIDQIFADLGPPEQEGQDGGSDIAGEPDSDTLDLDDLFEDKDDKSLEASDKPGSLNAGEDSALDLEKDFNKLFDEQALPEQKSEQEPDASTEAAPPSKDEPDWLAELDGLGLDEAPSQTKSSPSDASRNALPDISDSANADPEMKAEADIGDTPDTGSESETTLEMDLDTTDEALEDVPPVAEKAATDNPPGDEASTPKAALPESVLQRLQELENRLAALEQREFPQFGTPEPDLDGLLAQVDQRMDERVGSRLDSVQHAMDGLAEQVETVAAKIVDTELTKLSESMSADVEQRLKAHLEERLEELRVSMQEDIEQKFASGMNELKQDNVGQEAGVAPFPDGWRDELVALMDERLESLGMELRKQLTDEMDKAVPLAAARIIREEIQAMSQEEEGVEQ